MTNESTFTLDEVYDIRTLRKDINNEMRTQFLRVDDLAKVIGFPRNRVRAFLNGQNQPGWSADMILTLADWVGKDPGFYIRSSIDDQTPAEDWAPVGELVVGDGGTESTVCGLQPITTEQKTEGLEKSLKGIQSMGHRIAPEAPEMPQEAHQPSSHMEHNPESNERRKGPQRVSRQERLTGEQMAFRTLAAVAIIDALRRLIRG